ncbi:acyltransferase [Vibrio kanaloae]|uniref:acyltransferase n=1 Tax=Vibrio kanaloae TaxID=170673 RepID=UPI001EFDA3B6|nr:acyltransferase [Vibrio kanaloae]MCG9559366.1 acyltransferase [Vibrio kanaloae]
MHKIKLLYSYAVKILTCLLPDTPAIMRFRGALYSLMMMKCGRNFQVSATATIRGLQNISVGDDVYFGPNSYLISTYGVELWDEVLIAMNTVIIDGNHGIDRGSYRFAKGKRKKIVIGFGSWVAANCVISAGAEIGNSCVIGACCHVNSKIEDRSIIFSTVNNKVYDNER